MHSLRTDNLSLLLSTMLLAFVHDVTIMRQARAEHAYKCRYSVSEIFDCRSDSEIFEFGKHIGLEDNDSGLSFAGEWTMDTSVVFSGGADPGSWANRNLLDLYFEYDASSLGSEGTSLMVHFQNFAGESGSDDVGDLHVFSNIDNPDPFTQLSEVYLQQKLSDDRLLIILGKVDANSYFNYSEVAGDFLNSGKGNNPTTFDVMPTYPDPSTAVILQWQPDESIAFRYGLFDGRLIQGVPTGGRTFDLGGPYWMIGEMDFRWGGRCFSRLATGFWHHTFSRFERFDGGGFHDGMNGFYINYDRTLWLENCCDEEDEQGLYLNVNYGVTDEDVNSFPASITAGLVYRGALSGRDDDSMGATVVWSDLSDDIPGIDQEDEVHVEAYYRCQFNPNVTIQPTFTFIDEPANAANIPQALVGTLRIIAEF